MHRRTAILFTQCTLFLFSTALVLPGGPASSASALKLSGLNSPPGTFDDVPGVWWGASLKYPWGVALKNKVPFSSASEVSPGSLGQAQGPNGPYAQGVDGPDGKNSWGNLTLLYSILGLTDDSKTRSSKYSNTPIASMCYERGKHFNGGEIDPEFNKTEFNLLVNHMAQIMDIQKKGSWNPTTPYIWDAGPDVTNKPWNLLMAFFPRDNQTKAANFPPGAMLRVAATLAFEDCEDGYGGHAYLDDHSGWGVRVLSLKN